MGNVLVTPQLGTLTATPQLPEFTVQTNKQNSEDEKLRDDEPGQLPHAGGPDLGQVLPGGEERQQVCGRRVSDRERESNNFLNLFFISAILTNAPCSSKTSHQREISLGSELFPTL